MDQLDRYTIKSIALIPVVVATVAVIVAAPIHLTGHSSTNHRGNEPGFMAALAVGAALAFGSVGFMAKGVNKVTGDPGPYKPLPPINRKRR